MGVFIFYNLAKSEELLLVQCEVESYGDSYRSPTIRLEHLYSKVLYYSYFFPSLSPVVNFFCSRSKFSKK